jgi:RIO-like serine/threonine protein kinase
MKVNINLNLNDVDSSSILFLNKDITINVSQLYNLSTYLEQVRKIKNIKNFITEYHEILHAINYDSDDINNYWIILDRDYNFLDIRIPQIIDPNNEKIYTHLSELEIKIINLLSNFN